MKFKLIIGVLGIILFGIFGMGSVKTVIEAGSNSSALSAQSDAIDARLMQIQGQTDTLVASLSADGKVLFLDDVELARYFSQVAGATLDGIEALHVEEDGSETPVLTITDPEDVYFFTDNVDKIEYLFTLTDVEAFIGVLSNDVFISDEIAVYQQLNYATIKVPSSFYLLRVTDSSSGLTSELPELDPVGTKVDDAQTSTIVFPESESSNPDSVDGVLPDDMSDTVSGLSGSTEQQFDDVFELDVVGED